jgi:hypothetical protein
MTNPPPNSYRHTQKGPWGLILYAFVVLLVGLAWLLAELPTVPTFAVFIPGGIAGVFLVLGSCFHRLTVADEGDHLAVRFGFVPLFRKRIRYADIRAVEVGQTTFFDGWGIHPSTQGGWVWNIWGWDCVVIHHAGTTRVGTDDAENLAAFLRTKIPVPAVANEVTDSSRDKGTASGGA